MNDPTQLAANLRDALESAGLLDCDGPDAKREANRIIRDAIEKATVGLRQENLRLSAYCLELDKSERASRAAHASERCPGPRQHGHPLVYESHCDHGETKAHVIQPAHAIEQEEDWGLVLREEYIKGWYDHANGRNKYAEPTNAAMPQRTTTEK